MAGVRTPLRYWHTLRHLKLAQVTGRVRFRLARPRPDMRPAPLVRGGVVGWQPAARRRASMVAPDHFHFLGESRSLSACGWDDERLEKLWRYNLHYFDDLHGESAETRATWHLSLLQRWIAENPPAGGTGWEPYPVSLRVVNWIKWAWQGNTLPLEAVQSLAVQARWLGRRLEWHLLGNHLFVNAKALVFAGLFFEGPEAQGWLANGLRILREQVREQVLPDGGQFERSPMYHALALEDMLDLWNAMRATRAALASADVAWIDAQRPVIERMRRWLQGMTHPDGEIALFNDAAIGIAPSPAELQRYALRLGFDPLQALADGVTTLQPSGYIRVQRGDMVALLDVGPIGPDYLPGHAHADTLSFELSLFGRRVLVDSGTSRYGTGPERLRQRGTAAHNTLTIDGADSSEVWGGFRVARRAHPIGLQVQASASDLRVSCAHDGFHRLRGAPTHRRTWIFSDGCVEVRDQIRGPGRAEAHWHWAPGLEISAINPCTVRLDDRHALTVATRGADWSVRQATWHPEFGRSDPCWKAVTALAGDEAVVRITWSERAPSLPD
jgi:uncharacterized heparinase superfamily protein